MARILLSRRPFFTDNTRAKIINLSLKKALYHFNMLPVGFTHSMKNNPRPRSSLCHYRYQMTVAVNARSWRGYRFVGLDSGVMGHTAALLTSRSSVALSLDSQCPDNDKREQRNTNSK